MTPNNFRVKSGLTVGTTISGGNTTITGFVNATSTVNASALAVGTSFIANTTGAYHTGVVNAASLSVGTSFIANTTRVVIGTSTGLQANGGIGTAGQVLHSNGTTVYWAADDGITSIATANGLSGGTITSTGTLGVTTGSTLTVNTSGIHVNSALALTSLALTGSFTANGGIGTAGQVLHSNGTSVYWAADDGITSIATANGLSGGTITSTGTLGVTTGSTLTVNSTGIHVNTAALSIATSQLTGDVALGTNTSGNYVATISNANGISGSSSAEGGTPTIGVVTGSTLTVNTTGIHVNSALSITDLVLSGNLTVSGTRTYVNTTTLDVGDNIFTLNADLGAAAPTQDAGMEIMRGTSANVQFMWDETNDRWSTNGQPLAVSSLVATGAASGITTLAAGNTTITGFVNATASVNSAIISVGTSFIANTTGAYHTGTINAASLTVSTNVIANTTQVTSNVNMLINNNKHVRFQTANSSAYAYFVQQSDDNFVFYTSNTTYGQRAVWSVFANSITSTMRMDVPIYPIAGITANGAIGTAGQVLKSNGAGIFWDTSGGTGTVTSVATGNGLTGGTITTTGTLSVTGGSTLTVNTTGVHVNSVLSLDRILTSNNGAGTNMAVGDDAWFGDINTADTVSIRGQQSANNGYIVFGNADTTTKLGRAGLGALTYNGAFAAGNTTITGSVNATSSVNAASLSVGTSFIANSTQVTLGSVALSANGSVGLAGQTLHSNGTATYWSTDDNAGGTVTNIATANGLTGGTITTTGTLGVATGSTLTVNTTGIHVNSALSITSLALAGAASGITTLAAGNTTITGFANVTSTIQGGAGLTIAGALSGVTTAAMGNTTITGMANIVSSASLGGTATNLVNTFTINTNVGNQSYLKFYSYRYATGSDWTSASTRIQQRIDVTDQAYIEFNPQNYTYGVGVFGSSGKGLIVDTNGITVHTANVAMGNNYIVAPVLQAYSERLTALGSVTGSIGLDLSVSNFFTLTATGNITFSYSNAPSGRVFAFTIVFAQDATGGRTITWPSGTKWPGGSVPPATTTANAIDIWSVMTYDGGSTWIASLSVKNAA